VPAGCFHLADKSAKQNKVEGKGWVKEKTIAGMSHIEE